VLVVVPLPDPAEGDEVLADDDPVAGDGDTIDAFGVEPEDVVPAPLALEADTAVGEDEDGDADDDEDADAF
jgi:hypothetical protein